MDNTQNKLLFEETKKRLQTILEYTITPYAGTVDEADDNQEQDTPDADAMGADPMAGGDPNAQGDMPPMGGGAMGGAPDPNAMGAGPMAGGDPNAQEGQTPEGLNPQDNGGDMTAADFGASDPMAGGEQPGADDDVVDVSELTDAQKETQHDMDKLDAKFTALMKQIGSFQEVIKQNDEKIESLKAEFEKRNPTQIEKLSMRAAKSYPFNVTPEQYWAEKEKTSNYSIEDDKNGTEQGQYTITANDVNGDTDWRSIANSLDDDDFAYNQTLNGVLKF